MKRTRRFRTKMPKKRRKADNDASLIAVPQKMTKKDELDKLQEKSEDLPRTDASSEI